MELAAVFRLPEEGAGGGVREGDGGSDKGDGELDAVVPTVKGGASLAPLTREVAVIGEDAFIDTEESRSSRQVQSCSSPLAVQPVQSLRVKQRSTASSDFFFTFLGDVDDDECCYLITRLAYKQTNSDAPKVT